MNITLPSPKLDGTVSLERSIYERESIRRFRSKEIEIEKISQILWAAQGKKGTKRTIPSAGATYPLEIYVTLRDKGLFHYNIEKHMLEMLTDNFLIKKLVQASLDQYFIAEAYVNIIICARFSRTTQVYGKRGVRYVLIEVGHCAQNIHLQAVALGLASVPIGAYNDESVKQVLSLPKDIEPLYIIPIGYES
ncbi:MAG: SagB/ThcOx family dehydrogenase [Candidatus Heimdallarchaeota archaeon]